MSLNEAEREDPPWVKMAAQAHVHYRLDGMEDVAIQRDLAYKSADGEPLLFDLYRPVLETRTEARSCVVLIHGGPVPSNLLTRPKDWGCFESIGRLLGASGLSAIVFNHRFFGLERALDAMIDTRDLLDYVRENSEALGIDKNRLCLWSFSGGGVYLSPFLRETPDWLRAVVAYYSALHAPQPEFSAAMQISQNAGRIPALLTARAGLDMPALNEGIDLFIREALKKNASLDVYNHATGQHGFESRDDNPRTREILRRTLEFIQVAFE